jgi:hypothetical protein
MDDKIRNLTRAAVGGDPEAQARLDAALDRIGRQALAYRGPDPVPQRITAPPRRDSCPRVYNEKICVPRHRVLCASSADALERAAERRTRRAGRFACAEGLADYYESKEG